MHLSFLERNKQTQQANNLVKGLVLMGDSAQLAFVRTPNAAHKINKLIKENEYKFISVSLIEFGIIMPAGVDSLAFDDCIVCGEILRVPLWRTLLWTQI